MKNAFKNDNPLS